MGIVNNINFNEFPKQGDKLNSKVEVCYNYDTSKYHNGVIVRDDINEPFITIIKLENGNYILATECMYRIID